MKSCTLKEYTKEVESENKTLAASKEEVEKKLKELSTQLDAVKLQLDWTSKVGYELSSLAKIIIQ